MLGLPTMWLYAGLAGCVGLFLAGNAIKHRAALEAATGTGVAVGVAKTATEAVKSATETATIERQVEADTPPIPDDRAAKIALCKKRASCRERGQL